MGGEGTREGERYQRGRAEEDKEEKSFGCWLVVTTKPGIISAEQETWVRWQSGNGGEKSLPSQLSVQP